MRLLDCFAEAARGEMDFAPVAFGAVGAEEGLEEGGAGGFWLLVFWGMGEGREGGGIYLRGAGQRALKRMFSRAWTMASSRVRARTAPLLLCCVSSINNPECRERIKETVDIHPSMTDRKNHSNKENEEKSIPSGISQLGRRAPHQRHHTRRINHTAPRFPKLPHAHHRILAPPPHALDVDPHGQIPNLLLRLQGVAIFRVHDASVVEHDVDAAPGVEEGDGGADVGFAGDVAGVGLEGLGGGRQGGVNGVDFFEGGGEGGGGDVEHED